MAATQETSKRNQNGQGSSLSAISLPKGGGALKGIDEKFTVNAVNGTNSLTIPVSVAPARTGFSPSLSREWLWVLDEIRDLMEFLTPDGNNKLYALWKQLPGRHAKPNQARLALEQMRDLLLRLSQDWSRYWTFQAEPQIPWTNNATERAIGRMKMRARTVRGYKS